MRTLLGDGGVRGHFKALKGAMVPIATSGPVAQLPGGQVLFEDTQPFIIHAAPCHIFFQFMLIVAPFHW